MSSYKIYHNVSCSKSRETLRLLKGAGIEPDLRFYLDDPLSREELLTLASQLKMRPIEFTRLKEDEFKNSGLSEDSSDDEIIDLLVKFPKLIERPIVVKDDLEAVLGRPPENVSRLL